jgi:1-acyl-sn-glycerol-3-phosphate acyltransferase
MISNAICSLIRLMCGATAHWIGCDPDDRPRIYFANHASHLDFLLLWAALPEQARRKTRPVAARDYRRAGPIRRYLVQRVFHAVLIDRRNITRENYPLPKMIEAVRGGGSLILFPSGTRSRDGAVTPFQGSLHHLRRRLPDVEFIPVYLDNLNRILPKGEFLPVSLLICLMGFLGGLTMSAVKRDRGIKDYGSLIAGHGGMMDRIDSLCFAAPVFFHYVRQFYTL